MGSTACDTAAMMSTVRQEEIWDVEAAQSYDTPSTGMFAPSGVGPHSRSPR